MAEIAYPVDADYTHDSKVEEEEEDDDDKEEAEENFDDDDVDVAMLWVCSWFLKLC